MRAPPSDVWSNNALKLALKSWVLCLDPSLQIVPARLGPVRLIFQILELDSVACVWVSSRVCACAFSNFYRRFKLVKAFISQYCEKLKYDIPVHKSSLAIYFSLATFPCMVQSSASLLRAIFLSSHSVLSPLCLLSPMHKFPSTFYAEQTSYQPGSLCAPCILWYVLFCSHILYAIISFLKS